MATYYIKKIGVQWKYRLNDWPTDATGTTSPTNTLQGAILAVRSAAPSDCVVYPGVYSGSDVSSDGGFATNGNWTVNLRAPRSTDVGGYVGRVIIDGASATGGYLFKVSHTGYVLENFSLINGADAAYALSLQVNLSDSQFSTVGLVIDKCDRAVFQRFPGGGKHTGLRVTRIKNTQYSWYFYNEATAGTTIINNFVFANWTAPLWMQGANTTLTLNDGIFIGFLGQEVYGTCLVMTATNVVFGPGGMGPAGYGATPLSRVAGTWTLNNCFEGATATVRDNGNVSIVRNNCKRVNLTLAEANLCLEDFGRDGYINFQVDDSTNYSTFKKVCTLADTYAFKVGLALSYYGNESINWEELAGLVSSGHEVLCHARSDYRNHTLSALTCAHSGATVTIAVTRTDPLDSSTWAGTCTVSGTLSASVSLTDATANTITKLAKWLKQTVGLTSVAGATGQYDFTVGGAFNVDHLTLSVALASGTYNVNTAATLLFDQTSIYHTEWTEPKEWLESQIGQYIPGWECKGFVWPGGLYSDASVSYALDTSGFSYGRATTYDNGDGKYPSYLISALKLGKIGAQQINSQFTGSASPDKNEAGARAIHYCHALMTCGCVGGAYSHSLMDQEIAEIWGAVFDAARESGIVVDTFVGCCDRVVAESTRTESGICYRYADGLDWGWPDNLEARILARSSCVGAGIDTGVTFDFDGHAVPGAVGYDIGPYSYMPGWKACSAPLPLSAQPCKDHALPIGVGKITVFDGIADQESIDAAR